MLTLTRHRNNYATIFIVAALLHSNCMDVSAQQAELHRRIESVGRCFSPMPSGTDTLFAESFKAKVPNTQLVGLFAQLFSSCGSYVRHRIVSAPNSTSAEGVFETSKSFEIPFSIAIESAVPHRIVGLFLRPPVKASSSFDSVIADLRSLPGVTSLHITDLERNSVVATYNADVYLPIGSTFKLYVLGTLVRQIQSGQRTWYDVHPFHKDQASLPSGRLHKWPDASPLTLHTLACAMISESDNTATDMLHSIVGRSEIEGMQRVMGHSQPSRNIPFLNTRELFLLKYLKNAELGKRYQTLDSSARREFCDRVLRPLSLDAVEFVSAPVMVNSLEWFATTSELTTAMNWLRNQGHQGQGQPLPNLLGVLAINPGLQLTKGHWKYVGYKGGSEPGVINMTLLLQRDDERWFSASASWMNASEDDAEIDEIRLASILTAAVRLLHDAVPKQ